MGASTISVKPAEFPATVVVGRIDIAKPMSIINSKPDGAHLFETFMIKGDTYKIFYHIKDGKLASNVTVSADK